MAIWEYPQSDPAKQQQVGRYVSIELQIDRKTFLSQSTSNIRKSLEEAINQGLRARMASSGLTGPPYIEVVFLDPKESPATPPPWTPAEIYIPSAPSQMSEVLASVTDILQEVKSLDLANSVSDLRRLVNNTNNAITQLDAKEIQGKTVALIDEVRQTNQRVHQILDNPKIDPAIESLTDDLPKISTHMRDALAQMDQLLNDPQTRQTLASLNDTTAAAAPVLTDARRVLRQLDSLLSGQSQDLQAIVTDLRRVLHNTAAVTEEAKSNPSGMIFGEPPPHVTPGNSK
jgi:paraquat-inducible protein B